MFRGGIRGAVQVSVAAAVCASVLAIVPSASAASNSTPGPVCVCGPNSVAISKSMPTITGTAQVGKTLTAHVPVSSSLRGATLTYQWYAAGKKIPGATHATLRLGKAQLGKKIFVSVRIVVRLDSSNATVVKRTKATSAVKG